MSLKYIQTRISPELHRRASILITIMDTSWQAILKEAVELWVEKHQGKLAAIAKKESV